MISLIVAASKNNVIGEEGTIPWHISEDLIRMKKLTEGHPIIMGRKTHESISGFKNFEGWKHNEKFEHKLLPNRTNIIVTRQTDYEVPGGIVTHSLEEAIQAANKSEGSDEIFIIGGESLFKEGLSIAKRVYLTVIDREGMVIHFFQN
nr:dihydrofolate reductase [uncultured bacterium]